MIIHIAIVMSVIKEISRISKRGCDNKELLEYVCVTMMRSNAN